MPNSKGPRPLAAALPAPLAAALPALFAAALSVVAVCGGDAVARVFPFGPDRRSVNDLANQFVPFHAHLWDLLRGRADGGLLFDWRAGWGTAFLPDYGTYLSSPFAPLVALFPRGDIEYAVYAITVLKTAVAAAAMTHLLRRLGPGAWWWAAVLGASYALCGWSVVEATYNPMWLDGLIALPLLCLVGEWVREGRRPLLGPLVVAVCWVANFYTAYMATLGALLVLLVRLAVTDSFRARTLLRAAVTAVTGVGLAAPVLVPVLLGSRHAHPGLVREFAPAAGTDVLARLLPLTYSFSTPAAYVCTAVTLLAGALLFRRDVPGRERWLWPGLCAAVAASMQWGPTHLLWHAFATPNGSPYRQTFVLSGVLVLTAWTCLTGGGAGTVPDGEWAPAVPDGGRPGAGSGGERPGAESDGGRTGAGPLPGGPGRRAVAGGAAVVLVLALAALPSPLLTPWSLPLAGAGLAAVAGALLLPRRGRYGLLAALLVTGTLVGQSAATTAYADRERLGRLDDYPALGAAAERRAAALAAADGWPAYRTDSGLPRIAGNDPLLLGGQGAAYYSSHTPAVLTSTLDALGGGWTSRGRNLMGLDNPVTDALSGVGARWRNGAVVRTDVRLPLVTVRPPGPPPVYGPSPFRNQELLLGSRVYGTPRAGACPVGTEVFLWAPDATGRARLGDREVRLRGGRPKRQEAMVSLGFQRVPGLRPSLPGPGELGCLDHGRLRAAVTALRARAATSVEVTPSGIRAVLPPGGGTAVVAVPRTAGWHCEGAGPVSYGGFLAVPLGDGRTEISCAFRPPGLRAGLAAGAAAALLLAATAVTARRRARAPSPPGA
ncbi:YfhO family protein [Streptomyces sp. NPDC001744]|uniref:YfhO family protein n=1 Tax=Streptomyces sp. NPDC001744 TaxID=3364606 RepID=UPI0036CEB87D